MKGYEVGEVHEDLVDDILARDKTMNSVDTRSSVLRHILTVCFGVPPSRPPTSQGKVRDKGTCGL